MAKSLTLIIKAVLTLFLSLPRADAEISVFKNYRGPCYIFVDSLISINLVDELKIIEPTGQTCDYHGITRIVLNSEGGNLEAGFALGQYLRAIDAEAYVGVVKGEGPQRLDDKGPTADDWSWVEPGVCKSACAFAILGASKVEILPESRLGFHQWFLPPEQSNRLAEKGITLDKAVSDGQNVTSTIVKYLNEIGANARFLELALSNKDFVYLDQQQYELLKTPGGQSFSNFQIKAINNSIFVTSERINDAPRQIDEINFTCTSSGIDFFVSVNGDKFDIENSRLYAKLDNEDGKELSRENLSRFIFSLRPDRRLFFEVVFNASGGPRAELSLSQNDFDQIQFLIANCLSSNSSRGSLTEADIGKLRLAFESSWSQNRAYIQESLRSLGLYSSSIDGKWGKGTEGAFRKIFESLDQHYPDKNWSRDLGFDDGKITPQELATFLNSVVGCDGDKLLRNTDLCQQPTVQSYCKKGRVNAGIRDLKFYNHEKGNSYLAVRSQCNSKGQLKGELYRGDEVAIIQFKGSWIEIQCVSGRCASNPLWGPIKPSGCVFGKYVDLVEGASVPC